MKNLQIKTLALLIAALFLSSDFTFAQSWTASSGKLYANPTTTRVGIGTSNPSSNYMLHVNTYSKSGIYSYTSTSTKSSIDGYGYSGKGVYGRTYYGYGVYGQAYSSSGYAGYFVGKLGLTGDIMGLESSSTFNIYTNSSDSNGPYLRMYGQSSSDPGRISMVAGVGGSIQFYNRTSSSWSKNMTIFSTGKVAIGTDNTPTYVGGANISAYKLFVDGGILSEAVRVRSGWADYVFADDYELLPLEKVEAHIEAEGHLHNTVSAEEVAAAGLDLGEITVNQQEKIEELFLHVIELNKQLKELQKENKDLRSELEEVKQN